MTHPSPSAPKPDPRLKEQAIQDSVRLYRRQNYAAALRPSVGFGFFPQWKPFAAGALAALVVMAAALHIHDGAPRLFPQAMTNGDRLAVLREMKQVFGDRLEGVVQYKGNIEPVVNATGGAYTNAQPVIITLRQGNREICITSFSGNTVTVNLDHGKMSLSPVVTGDGHVIIEGRDFIWSQDKMIGRPSVILDAKTLGTSL